MQDPRNLGACLRVANAAGARAVLIPKNRAAPLNATARKAASGAAEHTPVVSVVNLARALRQLKAAGYWILGADAAAADSLFDFVPRQPLALILGAEAAGLRHNTRKQCDYLFHIPMLGEVESLNVSVAAGVCLYQLRSQWSRAPDDSGGKSS